MHSTQEALYQLVSKQEVFTYKSIRELGRRVGEQFPQNVKHHLQQLEKKELIRIDWDKNVIKVIRNDDLWGNHFLLVPILGMANCGVATIFAEEHRMGTLPISKSLLPRSGTKYFAVSAVGNSMNRARVNGMFSIEEGDFAIIDPDNRSPDPGDYVLSVINGCANIKRFYIDKEHGQLLLLSESSENQPPIRLHEDDNLEFFINGKVVTVIKQPAICPH